MKKFLIAALLSTFTINAFAVSEECRSLEGELQTDVGEFQLLTYRKNRAVHFNNKNAAFEVGARFDNVIAGGMKLDKDGNYSKGIWPVQQRPLVAAFDTAGYIFDRAEDFVVVIQGDRPEQRQQVMAPGHMPRFGSDEQPMYVKGIAKKILKKLNKVEVDESNAQFISCAKERLDYYLSLID